MSSRPTPSVYDALRAIAFQGHVEAAADNGIPNEWLARLLRCSEKQVVTAIADARAQAIDPSWIPSEEQHNQSFDLWVLADTGRRHRRPRTSWATTPLEGLNGRSPVQAFADGDLREADQAIRESADQ